MTTWRDRDGTLYERDDDTDHRCCDGQEDEQGRVIASRTCRPALAARLDRQRRQVTDGTPA